MTATPHAERSSPHWLRHVVFILLAITFTIGLIWRFTPLHHYFDVESVTRWSDWLQKNPWTPVIMPVVFATGGLFLFAHAVLLWATAFIFPPGYAILYCELGSLSSGLTVYGLGRVLRPAVIKRLGGSSVGRVTRDLASHGRWTIILLHWFPVCPFSMLNLLAGATHIELGDFLIGTFIGSMPGVLFVCLIGHRILHVLHHPSALEIAGLVTFVAIGFMTLRTFRKRLSL